MRILMITATPPFPPIDGYALRCYHLARSLARSHEVHLLTGGDHDQSVDYEALSGVFTGVTVVPHSGHPALTLLHSLTHLQPYHVSRYASSGMGQALRRLVEEQQFDVIYANFIYFSRLLAALGPDRPLLVLDQHNLDRDMWEQKAKYETSLLRRVVSRVNLWLTRAFEEAYYPIYDLVVSVSERDCAGTLEVNPNGNVIVAPNGIDLERYSHTEAPSPRLSQRILFVGSNVHMNVQAVNWFATRVFPIVRTQLPGVEFEIVGNLDPARIAPALSVPGVVFRGRVPEVTPHFSEARLFVAPFFVGAGSKLKVLEAFAAQCPVVATEAGMVGIFGAVGGEHFLLAGDEQQFGRASIELLQDGEKADKLAKAARCLVESRYDWSAVGERVEEALMRLSISKSIGVGE